MTLRRKTLLVLAATIAIGTLVLYAAASSLLLGSFADLEERDTRQHVVRVLDALSADMMALRSMASNWATWDDGSGPGSPLLRHARSEPLAGLMLLPEQEILLAAWPILDLQGHGPSRGTLIIGRYLDTVRVNSLVT